MRTFDTYNDVDCFYYYGLHDYIKFLKYGYTKVTDHASREIRLKRLTRDDGIKLIKRYSNIMPKDKNLFLDWLGIDFKELIENVNKFRSKDIWEEKNKFKYLILYGYRHIIKNKILEIFSKNAIK